MRRHLSAGLAAAVVLVTGGLAVTAASAGPGGAIGAPAPRASTPDVARAAVLAQSTTPLVLVSGRDDHGELVSEDVALHSAPGSRQAVGEVRDGTLARVVRIEGTWLQVRTVEGPPVEGWVDDFYLRREVHLVGGRPTCEVSLAGRRLPAGEQALVLEVRDGRARVRLVSPGRGSASGWVPRAAVHELAPREGCGVDASGHASGGATEGGHHH